MAILVCGGAGYVGSHCLEGLRQAGFDCVVVDNLTRGHRAAVGDTPLYVGDISDLDFMDQVFRQHPIEAVMHFAAASQVGESMQDPLLYYENNLCATVALLRAMQRHEVKRIVFSSSAAVYGEPELTPIPEDSPKSPTNTYGETKLATGAKLRMAWNMCRCATSMPPVLRRAALSGRITPPKPT